MIWLTKLEIATQTDRVEFTVCVDASAAGIRDRVKMRLVEHELDKKIDVFSVGVRRGENYNEGEQGLKNYLCDDLFKYGIGVDVVAINNFIYNLKINILRFTENMGIAGYLIIYQYKNYKEEKKRWRE